MNVRLCVGLAALVLLCLVQSSLQKGVLHADIIYSSSEDTITIDRLLGDSASVTQTQSDIISFGSHDELNIDAPGIQATGSFFSARVSDSISFQSTADDINVTTGDSLEASSGQNVNFVSTLGDLIVDARRGKINFKSGDHIEVSSSTSDISITSQPGGVRVQSEGGHILFDAGDDIQLTGTGKAQMISQETASFAASDALTLNAQGAAGSIDFDAPAQLSIVGSTSVSFSSSQSSVTFDIAGPLDFHANRDFSARSTSGSMNLLSSTDGITVLSGLAFTATAGGSLNVKGSMDGVLLQSGGDSSNSKVTIDAPNGKIDFTSRGDGDLNGVHINVGSTTMSAQSNVASDGSIIRVHAVNTLSATATQGLRVIAGEQLSVESDAVTLTAGTTATVSSQADDLFITAFDRSNSNEGNGLVTLDANQNLNLGATSNVLVDGGDIFVASTTDNILFDAGRVTVNSNRAAGDEQLLIPAVGRDWRVTASTGNVAISGGSIEYQSVGSNTFNSAQSIVFNGNAAPGNRIVFNSAGPISTTTAASSSFNAGGEIAVFAGGNSSTTAQTSLTFTTLNPDFARLFTFHSNTDTFINANTVDITSSGIQRWSARDDASFVTQTEDISVSANTINLFWNTVVGNAFTFTSQSNNFADFKVSESTDATDLFQILGGDSVSFVTNDNTFRITTGDLLQVLSGRNFEVTGSSIMWQTDERSNFTITSTGSSLFDTQDSINVRGNSLDFVGADVSAVADTISLNGVRRGLWSRSDANLNFNINSDLSPVSITSLGGDNAFIAKEDLIVTSTTTASVTSGGGARVLSGGSISLKSFTDSVITSAQNISITAGSEVGSDVLTLFSGDSLTWSATDSIAVSAAQNGISISAKDSFTASSSSIASQIISKQDVEITTGSYVQSANELVLQGGNVDLDASKSFKLDATGTFQLRSEPSTFGYNNTKNVDSTVLFDGDAKLSVTATNLISVKGQNNTILSADIGSFSSTASNILLQTVPSDMDSDFSSGAAVVFTATSTQFPIEIDSSNDLLFAAQTGNMNITGGSNVNTNSGDHTVFNATGCIRGFAVFQDFIASAGSLNEKSDYALHAGSFASYTTNSGIIDITSLGFSFLRSDDDGRSPTEGADYFDTVGFSIRTTEETDGNILVQSSTGISINAGPVLIRSPEYVNITGENGVSVTSTSSTITITSLDGNIDALGARGVDINSGEVSVSASTKFQMRTKNSMNFQAASAINIQSEEGSILGFTNNREDITYFSEGSLQVKAGGSGADFKVQGSATINSNVLIVKGFSETDIATLNGPIIFNARTENIALASDFDFTLTSGGSQTWTTTANNISVSAGVNGYFSTDAGNIDINASNLFKMGTGNPGVDGGDLTIRSLGTSQSGRDRVLLSTLSGPVLFDAEGNIAIDAIEEVLIGVTTLPVVTFLSGGSDSVPGFTLSSGTNIEFSDVKGQMETVALEDITFKSVNSHTIDTFGAVTFTTTGPEGFRALSRAPAKIDAAVGGILIQSTDTIKLSSDEFFSLDANGAVVGTDDVTFNSDLQIISDANDIAIHTDILYDVVVTTAFPGQPNIAVNGDARVTLSTTDGLGGSILFEALSPLDGDLRFTSTAPQYWSTTQHGADFTFVPAITTTLSFLTNTNSSDISFFSGTTITATSVSADISFSPTDNLILRSKDFSFQAANNILLDGTEQLYSHVFSGVYTATAGDINVNSAGANVTFDSTNSHSIDSTTTFDVNTLNTAIVDVSFSLTQVGRDFIVNGDTGTAFNVFSPTQSEGAFNIQSPGNFDVDSAAGSITFSVAGPHSNLKFNTGTDLTVNAVDIEFISGDNGRSIGKSTFDTTGKITFTAPSFEVDNKAYSINPGAAPTATQHALSNNFVEFSADGTLTTESSISTFNINGNNPGSGYYRAIANTTISFESQTLTTTSQGGSILHFADTITYNADNFLVHTEGADSEVLFRSRFELLDIDATTSITVEANNDISFTTAQQILLDSPVQSFSTTIDGNDNNRGIILQAPTIGLPATTTTVTTNDARSDIFITGGAVNLIFNDFNFVFSSNPSSLTVLGRGGTPGAYAGYINQLYGVVLTAPTGTVSAPAITFNGGEALNFDAAAGVLSFTASNIANIQSRTRAHLYSPSLTLTAQSYRFEADNTIEVASNLAAGIAAVGNAGFSIISGLEQPDASRIGFTASTSVGFSSFNGDVRMTSEDNIIGRALDSLTISSTSDDVRMIADYGSQLYYSTRISPATTNDLTITAINGNIEMTVYGELRHRESEFVSFFINPQGTNPTLETIDAGTWNNIIEPNNWSPSGPASLAASPCVWSNGVGNNGIVDCPQVASRAYQIALALDNYGLMNII